MLCTDRHTNAIQVGVCVSTRPVARWVQVGALHALQIWMQPLGICKISNTNTLISPLKTCDTLQHPRVASIEPPWLETTHFQICMYMHILSVQRHVTSWRVRGSNPGGGETSRTLPDRPWGPPSLLYNGYWVSLPGVKRPGRGVDHPPPSNAEVK